MLGYKSPGQAVGKGGSIIGHRHLQVLKTVSPLLALRMSVSLLARKLPKPQENPGEAAISEQFPTSWDAEVTQDQTTTNLHTHRHCLDALPGSCGVPSVTLVSLVWGAHCHPLWLPHKHKRVLGTSLTQLLGTRLPACAPTSCGSFLHFTSKM